MFSPADHACMADALDLASKQLGKVAPNPAVGCVIVKEGQIVGSGATAAGGRPHAETQALAIAGAQAKGATAYVTLEPCAHHGKTPPCAAALVDAGISRVVVACSDTDPRVNGRGLEYLRAHNVQVETGLMEERAQQLNRGFFLRVKENRPLVTLKIATSLDGMIATASGESKWITGEEARMAVQQERARHDAVLTGIGTVLADDPQLTVRLPDQTHQPIRIVLDTQLALPLQSRLVQSANDSSVWVIGTSMQNEAVLAAAGVKVLAVKDTRDIKAVLAFLAEQGLTRVMVEAGSKVFTSFQQSGLYDRILWFRAPSLIGSDGLPALGPLDLKNLSEKKTLRCVSCEKIGSDMMEIYEKD